MTFSNQDYIAVRTSKLISTGGALEHDEALPKVKVENSYRQSLRGKVHG